MIVMELQRARADGDECGKVTMVVLVERASR
jgi:hypothetical protein